MATATLNPPVTEVVKPATITLELTMEEAMLIDMFVSYTNTSTCPEADAIMTALGEADVEDYYSKMHLTTEAGLYGPTLVVNEGPNPKVGR